MLVLLLSLVGHAAAPPPDATPLPSKAVDAGIVELGEKGRITAIIEGSPAWNAGLRAGEALVRIEGRRVATMEPEEVRGRLMPQAEQLTVQVKRGEGTEEVQIALAPYDALNSAVLAEGQESAEPGVFWCAQGDCDDGNGKAEHTTGATYIGYFAEGLADGYGSWKAPDGSRYEGAWKEGLRDGPGAFRDATGNTYAGVWTGGVADGQFTIRWKDGRVYEGQVRALVPHGQGTLVWPDGQRYDGAFDYGDFHGQGSLTMADGQIYTGAFQNSIAHGLGKLVLPRGDRLEGAFYKGKLQGEGEREWSDDGRIFTGTFKDNDPHGRGIMRWPDQRRHLGLFTEGEASGLGVHVFPNGRRVVAQFTGEHRGLGQIIDGTDTVVYEGWIVRGMAEGYGRELKNSGDFRRDRFYFNDKPRGDHPRSLEIGKAEKEAFRTFEWTILEPLKSVRDTREELDTAIPATSAD